MLILSRSVNKKSCKVTKTLEECNGLRGTPSAKFIYKRCETQMTFLQYLITWNQEGVFDPPVLPCPLPITGGSNLRESLKLNKTPSKSECKSKLKYFFIVFVIEPQAYETSNKFGLTPPSPLPPSIVRKMNESLQNPC